MREDYDVLSQEKTLDMPIFTALPIKHKPLSQYNFEKELNYVLKKASLKLHKFLRTHSFRAPIITEVLESMPIQDVAEYMGHRSISRTLE